MRGPSSLRTSRGSPVHTGRSVGVCHVCGQEDVLHLRAVPGIPGCCEGLKCVGPPGPFLRDKQGTQPSWVGSPGSQTLAAEMSAVTPPAFNVHFAFGDDAAYDKKTKGGFIGCRRNHLKSEFAIFQGDHKSTCHPPRREFNLLPLGLWSAGCCPRRVFPPGPGDGGRGSAPSAAPSAVGITCPT